MSQLSQLYPQPLWKIFAKICTIPHVSYYEEELATYIVQWVNKKGLFVERDKIGNILIRKSAMPGYEHLRTVIIQAHLDMVKQKNNDTVHNFIKDPIQPWIDGEWVKAQGTTLGADNGIGLASALAVLTNKSLPHGPLEVLLTMTEEIGMKGAFGLQTAWLQGEILINTDSEEEGQIYIGCAGGMNINTQLSLTFEEKIPKHFKILQVALKGLKGGHSGCDIHIGLGNANKLLASFLADFCSMLNIRLLDFNGGTLTNAIPREACAIIALQQDKIDILRTQANTYLNILNTELSAVEKKLVFNISDCIFTGKIMTQACSDKFIALLNTMPNGIICMSNDFQDVVETSVNVGIVAIKADKAEICCLIRSITDSGKSQIEDLLQALGRLHGATTIVKDDYPSWKPDNNSTFIHLVSDIYQKLFNKIPDIKIIHAGLECGLFKQSYPNMDIVSIGPTIKGTHSPEERVNIVSVAKYWQFLTSLLQLIPAKSK